MLEEEKLQPTEEKTQEVEVVESAPVEKIGFNTAPVDNSQPGVPVTKKKTKFSRQQKTGLQKACVGFFVPSTILSVIALSFFLMPILSAIAGIIAFLIIGLIILIPILATAFIILASGEYRTFVGKAWSIVEWFFGAANHVAELAPYYWMAATPALVFELTTIILCIVTLAKKQKGVVAYLVITSIFFIIISVLTIFYFISGMQIFVISK